MKKTINTNNTQQYAQVPLMHSVQIKPNRTLKSKTSQTCSYYSAAIIYGYS